MYLWTPALLHVRGARHQLLLRTFEVTLSLKKVLKQEGSVYSWNVVDDMLYFNFQFALSPNYLRIVCLKWRNQVCLELQKIYKCVALYNIIMKVNK